VDDLALQIVDVVAVQVFRLFNLKRAVVISLSVGVSLQ